MPRRAGWIAWLSLAAVSFFWGTTYLAIRISIETISPGLVICSRFLLSGSILLLFARMKGSRLPRGRELWVACGCGLMVLGIGNAAAVYAEQFIPSGLASLFVTISPFWLVGFEAMMGGERLHGPTVFGMLVGFAGTALLLLPGAGAIDHRTWLGFLIAETGVVGWTLGSLVQRNQSQGERPARAHPIVTGAVQQLAAGVAYIPVVLFSHVDVAAIGRRSVWAVLYLVVFGSIVGYSAFILAMDRLSIAIVSIYPYFNALVAMWLGWLFFREPFGSREWSAMHIIFAGVGIVKWQNTSRTGKAGAAAGT